MLGIDILKNISVKNKRRTTKYAKKIKKKKIIKYILIKLFYNKITNFKFNYDEKQDINFSNLINDLVKEKSILNKLSRHKLLEKKKYFKKNTFCLVDKLYNLLRPTRLINNKRNDIFYTNKINIVNSVDNKNKNKKSKYTIDKELNYFYYLLKRNKIFTFFNIYYKLYKRNNLNFLINKYINQKDYNKYGMNFILLVDIFANDIIQKIHKIKSKYFINKFLIRYVKKYKNDLLLNNKNQYYKLNKLLTKKRNWKDRKNFILDKKYEILNLIEKDYNKTYLNKNKIKKNKVKNLNRKYNRNKIAKKLFCKLYKYEKQLNLYNNGVLVQNKKYNKLNKNKVNIFYTKLLFIENKKLKQIFKLRSYILKNKIQLYNISHIYYLLKNVSLINKYGLKWNELINNLNDKFMLDVKTIEQQDVKLKNKENNIIYVLDNYINNLTSVKNKYINNSINVNIIKEKTNLIFLKNKMLKIYNYIDEKKNKDVIKSKNNQFADWFKSKYVQYLNDKKDILLINNNYFQNSNNQKQIYLSIVYNSFKKLLLNSNFLMDIKIKQDNILYDFNKYSVNNSYIILKNVILMNNKKTNTRKIKFALNVRNYARRYNIYKNNILLNNKRSINLFYTYYLFLNNYMYQNIIKRFTMNEYLKVNQIINVLIYNVLSNMKILNIQFYETNNNSRYHILNSNFDKLLYSYSIGSLGVSKKERKLKKWKKKLGEHLTYWMRKIMNIDRYNTIFLYTKGRRRTIKHLFFKFKRYLRNRINTYQYMMKKKLIKFSRNKNRIKKKL